MECKDSICNGTGFFVTSDPYRTPQFPALQIIQRCDSCDRFEDDDHATRVVARIATAMLEERLDDAEITARAFRNVYA